MKLILSGSEIKNQRDFHEQIKKLLDLPNYYGENLDALWDCLTGWIDTPLTIIWKDFNISRAFLGEFADKAMSVFKDAEKVVEGFKIEQDNSGE